MRGRQWLAAVAAVVAVGCLEVSGASAAVRYAEPGGDGPPERCRKANPCSLLGAVEADEVADGDRVLLAPGEYELFDNLQVSNAITIAGTRGKAQETIVRSVGLLVPNFVLVSFFSTLRDFTIDSGTNATNALFAPRGAVLDRMFVTGSAQRACQIGVDEAEPQPLIRNTVCWSTQFNMIGLGLLADGGTVSARVRNVTAYASGGGASLGLTAGAINAGTDLTVDARNVIAVGASADVRAEKEPASAAAAVVLFNSSYNSIITGPGATVTPFGTNGNQFAEPLLIDPEDGDFQQLRASPTRDAGGRFADIGDFDLDGHARGQGSRPDIGAFEFTAKRCGGEAPTFVGRAGRDNERGTKAVDVMLGLGGDDNLSGLGGKDLLCGGRGDDVLNGGGARDSLNGGGGNDECRGGPGRDSRPAAGCELTSSIP